LDDVFPLAFLPKDHALAVAIMSYNGAIDYGLLGDYDALPDIDLIADGIAAALEELLRAARGKRPGWGAGVRPPDGRRTEDSGSNGSPIPIIPKAHTRPKHGPAADMRAKRERGSRPTRKRPDA